MGMITNNLYDAEKYGVVSPVGKNALKVYNFILAGVFEDQWPHDQQNFGGTENQRERCVFGLSFHCRRFLEYPFGRLKTAYPDD